MVSEKTKKKLKELGLTEYETRAYTGLVTSGPSTAGDLSETSEVPQSRIYDVLSKLEKKGWIESQSGRPARYRAKPPSEAIRLTRMKKEEKLKRASEVIQKELEPLYEGSEEVEKPEVWTIRGKQEIFGRIEEMFAEAEREVLISIPTLSEGFSDLKELAPIIEPKNIDLRILTSEKSDFVEDLLSSEKIKVRFRDPLFGGGVIVDGKEVLLVLKSGDRSLGIWSEELGLAKYAKEYFEYLWKDSKKG